MAGDDALSITIEPPDDDGGANITHYNVDLCLDNGVKVDEWDGKQLDGNFKLSANMTIHGAHSVRCTNNGYSTKNVDSWICVSVGKTLLIAAVPSSTSNYVKLSANNRARHFTVDGVNTILELSRVHITHGRTNHPWGGCLIAGHGKVSGCCL